MIHGHSPSPIVRRRPFACPFYVLHLLSWPRILHTAYVTPCAGSPHLLGHSDVDGGTLGRVRWCAPQDAVVRPAGYDENVGRHPHSPLSGYQTGARRVSQAVALAGQRGKKPLVCYHGCFMRYGGLAPPVLVGKLMGLCPAAFGHSLHKIFCRV